MAEIKRFFESFKRFKKDVYLRRAYQYEHRLKGKIMFKNLQYFSLEKANLQLSSPHSVK